MEFLDLVTSSASETQELGMRIGELSREGDVILLVGNLGAGKTCLTQGIAWGLGIKEYAMSPSFVLIREYQGRLPLYHIDFYRIDRIEEVQDLGLEDYLCGEGVSVVEWAEKGMDIMPGEHLLINMRYISPRRRGLRIQPRGQRYIEMLKELHRANIKVN